MSRRRIAVTVPAIPAVAVVSPAASLLAALFLAGVVALAAQAQPSPDPSALPRNAEPSQTVASPAATPAAEVDLAVAVRDESGAAVASPSAADLVVRQAGEARPVLELAAESRPWRLVIYFDAALAAGPTLPRAAAALESLAPRLVALGEVEVLLAEDTVRRVLPPTRDPASLAAALARVLLVERGEDRIVELRRRVLADPAVLTAAAADEAAIARHRLDLLLESLAERSPGQATGPAAVFWVTDGYDLDPTAWRRAAATADDATAEDSAAVDTTTDGSTAADPAAVDNLRVDTAAVDTAGVDTTGVDTTAGGSPSALAHPTLANSTTATARALAALGWTVVPVALRGEYGDDPSRWGSATMDTPSGETKIVGSVWLPRRRTAAERAEDEIAAAEPPPPVPVAPVPPLAAFAAASGGELVVAGAAIADAVDRLAVRLRLRYAASAAESGESQPLAVAAAAPGLDVVAPRWTASAAPLALAELRARHLLAGALGPGRFEVQAAVAVAGRGGAGEAALEVHVAPPLPIAPGSGGEVRLTLATEGEDGAPRVVHRRLAAASGEASGEAAAGDPVTAGSDPAPAAWSWRGAVDLPPGADRVAVLIEDPLTGAWAGTLAGVVDLSLEAGGRWDADAGVLPGPGPVRLLRPEGAMLAGPVRFETLVAPSVARVELWLDGRRAATVAAAPFTAEVDLGRLPLPRRVEAVAFDAAGAELGRDETVVNGGAGSLRVRLVEPASGRAVGPVTVAVEVTVPDGRSLDRVELYWRERRVATLFQPPFRHRLTVPAESLEGALRAVARLVDGGEAEDAVYLNGAVPSERLDVALTELYVVVAGDDGRPVRGLGRGDFSVREDGRRQEIATFGDASELPITLGLALDTSASMFVKLPAVREAALAVLDDLVPERDQAVLVEFGSQARLAAGPTRDLDRLRAVAGSLQPGGRTSLWEAVVFSLVQLQGAAGRRALIVYSDGADEDGDVSYRTALAFARRIGVPVYAIVANNEAARRGGIDLGLLPSLGGRIERLTAATGGRAWVVRGGDDLAPYYAEIRAELAAQYRLGYYPPSDGGGGWRRVTVDVARRGATARTIAGYRR